VCGQQGKLSTDQKCGSLNCPLQPFSITSVKKPVVWLPPCSSKQGLPTALIICWGGVWCCRFLQLSLRDFAHGRCYGTKSSCLPESSVLVRALDHGSSFPPVRARLTRAYVVRNEPFPLRLCVHRFGHEPRQKLPNSARRSRGIHSQHKIKEVHMLSLLRLALHRVE
jgi:hypothetical protein